MAGKIRKGQKVQTPDGRATVLETKGYNGRILVQFPDGATWLYGAGELR